MVIWLIVVVFTLLTCETFCRSPPGEEGSLQHIQWTERQISCPLCSSGADGADTAALPRPRWRTGTWSGPGPGRRGTGETRWVYWS